MRPTLRFRAVRALLRAKIEAVLRQGGVLGIFPEGRLGEEEGCLQPLRSGVVHFAQAGQVPVVPLGISGTRELWLRRPLRLRLGPPLQLAGPAPAELTRLHEAMRKALPPREDGKGPRRWTWLTNLLR